jgi:hypothetical protein
LLVFRNIVTPANTTEPADYRLFIYDWPTEQFVAITSAWTGRRIVGTAEWRPGTHELWFDLDSDGFAIWKPGNEMVVLDGSLFPYQEALGRASAFTRDGRHWFSRSPGVRSSVSVGMADDPTAPLLQLHPSGTQSDRYWTVDDGRLLVEAWSVDERRSDLHLVDADARTTRAMGNAGRVVAVGQGRALALLNWQSARSSGELTLIELASGHRRMLGADVYAVAVDREASDGVRIPTDTLAPGARVAFLIRNRLESRDDGLWVATLP